MSYLLADVAARFWIFDNLADSVLVQPMVSRAAFAVDLEFFGAKFGWSKAGDRFWGHGVKWARW